MAKTKSTTFRQIEPGVYETQYSLRAVVSATHGRVEKRFPKHSDLGIIRRWRNEMRTKLRFAELHRRAVASIPVLPRDLDGWCYLYVIGGIDTVKIGRTVNPHVRLSELQTGHDFTLTLLAAVPIHASLEAVIHRRFQHLKTAGEWFFLNDEMAQFVEDLQLGKNPVTWAWEMTTLDGKLQQPQVLLRSRRSGSRPLRLMVGFTSDAP